MTKIEFKFIPPTWKGNHVSCTQTFATKQGNKPTKAISQIMKVVGSLAEAWSGGVSSSKLHCPCWPSNLFHVYIKKIDNIIMESIHKKQSRDMIMLTVITLKVYLQQRMHLGLPLQECQHKIQCRDSCSPLETLRGLWLHIL